MYHAKGKEFIQQQDEKISKGRNCVEELNTDERWKKTPRMNEWTAEVQEWLAMKIWIPDI
jgi:hypothetical protein